MSKYRYKLISGCVWYFIWAVALRWLGSIMRIRFFRFTCYLLAVICVFAFICLVLGYIKSMMEPPRPDNTK